jgi:16S rRNA processing protein RimM
MAYDDWTWTVGEVTAPFARFGEVKVSLRTDFPDRFARLKEVCLRPTTGVTRLFEVEKSRLHKGQILLKLRGIDSINDAETLRGCLVQVRPQDAVPLGNNEFYVHDLLGCEVSLPDGTVLGELTNVLHSTGNDVYVIGRGKNEILLPAIREVVQSVDIDARRIVVTPTPGLMPGEAEEA